MDGDHDRRPLLSRRALLRLALAGPLASGLVAIPTVPTMAGPHPVEPKVTRLPLGSRLSPVAGGGADGPSLHGAGTEDVLTSGRIDTGPFRVAGVTWRAGGDAAPTLWVRTRRRGGPWSEWTELHDDGHAPDAGTPEARTARPGTDALVTTGADGIEVRIASGTGRVPDDLRVELVQPGESTADETVGTAQPGAAHAADGTRPTIHSRADWGADESIRSQSEPRYGEVSGTFIHHTAGSNSYDRGDVPSIIRGIYAYHVNGRGWRDLGYNFVIDKFGRIWEGRYGGIDRAVIGAHTLSYNSYAFAGSVLGTYVSKEPESEVLRAFESLIAWKFTVHGVDSRHSVPYPGLRTLPAISGHRDGVATECPGERLYAQLGTVREGVAGDSCRPS